MCCYENIEGNAEKGILKESEGSDVNNGYDGHMYLLHEALEAIHTGIV